MKKIVIVAAVLVLALLVAPWGIGKVAEKRFNEDLDWMVAQAPYLKIVERKWTRGWFKSEQVVTIEAFSAWMDAINPKPVEDAMKKDAAEAADGVEPGEPGEPAVVAAPDAVPPPAGEMPAEAQPKMSELMRFTVRNEVLHGPVLGLSGFGIARVNSHLVMSEDTQKEITAIFGTKEPIEISTRLGFFGGVTTTLKSEGRTIKPEGTAEVSWETFRVDIGASRKAQSFDLEGKWPKLEIKGLADKTHFVMKDMTMDGEATHVRGDLYDGDFNFRIASMSILGGDNDQVEIADFHYIADVVSKDDFTSMGTRFGTGAMKSQQLSTLGIELKEAHLDLSMRRLHTETLEKVLAGIKAMYAIPLTGPLEANKVMFAPFQEHGAALLKYDPELSLDRIGIVTPDGDGYLKGVIKLQGATPEDFGPGNMGLIGKIHADLTIDLSEKMVKKFPNGEMAASGEVDSGYLERKGDRLVCKIVFARGALTVNGKPQAIPGLGGPQTMELPAEGAPPQE